ncbi:hypothetical protein [Alkalihalobacillus deserti]|uniref:hypothetical protein n=1 Tax=Alkalihalobacillus deserti TaxID=2879466 RepID=UPI001D13F6C6|nr:hypothetical protein [Alkalihalobacillus deserti]
MADFLGGKTEERKRYAVDVQAIEDATCFHIPYPVIEDMWDDRVVRDFVLEQVTIRLQDIYLSFAEQVQLASN